MTFNLANTLTLFRLALLPLLILLMFVPTGWAAWTCLLLYVVGSVTDALDGWVARKFNQITAFGTFLDPIADKIFVASVLIMLVATDRVTGIWVLAVIVILVREFVVAGLREFLGPKNIRIPVTPLAKWKTAVQMLATGLLLIPQGQMSGTACLVAAAVLTVITGWNYIKASWPHITGKE